MKRNKNLRNGIIVAVLLLAVGFATVTTTLLINGDVGVTKMTSDFDRDLVFTKGELYSENTDGTRTKIADVTPTGEGKELNFDFGEDHKIASMDDKLVLVYTVKNNSDFNTTFDAASFADIAIFDNNDNTVPPVVVENPYITVEPQRTITETLAPEAETTGEYTIVPSRAFAGDTDLSYNIDIEIVANGDEVTTGA